MKDDGVVFDGGIEYVFGGAIASIVPGATLVHPVVAMVSVLIVPSTCTQDRFAVGLTINP